MNTRIAHLQKQLKGWKIDAILIEKPIDLFYLTDLKLSKGRLWVWPDRAELVVDGRYFGAAEKKAPCAVSLWVKGKDLILKGKVGLDSAWTTVESFEKLKIEAPEVQWISIAQPLRELRIIKEPIEIQYLREAAKITWEGIQHIRKQFVEGVTEQELAMEFEFFVRKQGASGLAFESIVAFGENSAYPHHRASEAKLKKDQIILIDVGAMYEQYCADVTRTFFFGRPDPQLQMMADLVRKASEAAQKKIRIGAKIGECDRAARDVFSQAGVEIFFTHNLGHGLGLEAHEPPTLRWDGDDQQMIIQAQMVIAVEPGLYRPGIGGVRYENSGVVNQNGFESFYPAYTQC